MKQRNYSCQHRFTFKHICFFSLTTPSHFSLERLQDGGQAHPVTHKQKQIYFPKSNKKKRNTLSLSKHQLPLSCTRTHYYHTLTRFRFLYIYIYIFLHKSPLVSLSLSISVAGIQTSSKSQTQKHGLLPFPPPLLRRRFRRAYYFTLLDSSVTAAGLGKRDVQRDLRVVRLHGRKGAPADYKVRPGPPTVPVRVGPHGAQQRPCGAQVLDGLRGVSARRDLGLRGQRRARRRDQTAGGSGERHDFLWVPGDGPQDGGRYRRRPDPDAGPGQPGGDTVRCGSPCRSDAE
jgi:hypothetical protein